MTKDGIVKDVRKTKQKEAQDENNNKATNKERSKKNDARRILGWLRIHRREARDPEQPGRNALRKRKSRTTDQRSNALHGHSGQQHRGIRKRKRLDIRKTVRLGKQQNGQTLRKRDVHGRR